MFVDDICTFCWLILNIVSCCILIYSLFDWSWRRKQLQQEFLDHGVLTLLKNWLEPLPDGSLPNINIRAAILKILTDVCHLPSASHLLTYGSILFVENVNIERFLFAFQFPIDLEQFDRREQLKKSGLGKVSLSIGY